MHYNTSVFYVGSRNKTHIGHVYLYNKLSKDKKQASKKHSSIVFALDPALSFDFLQWGNASWKCKKKQTISFKSYLDFSVYWVTESKLELQQVLYLILPNPFIPDRFLAYSGCSMFPHTQLIQRI